MANYAQTVNVIGAHQDEQDATAVFDTTGLVLTLYRKHFGTIPVEIGGAPEPLDVAAAWRENGRALTISVVNPTRQAQTMDLAARGPDAAGDGAAVAGERDRREGVQRAGQAAAGGRPGDGRRADRRAGSPCRR